MPSSLIITVFNDLFIPFKDLTLYLDIRLMYFLTRVVAAL